MKLLSFTSGLLSLLLSFGVSYAEPTVELSVADFTKVARTVELQRKAIATSKQLDAVKSQHIKELNEALKSCETIGNDQDQLIVQAKAALDSKEREVQSWKEKSERQTTGVWASVGLAVAAVVFAFAK